MTFNETPADKYEIGISGNSWLKVSCSSGFGQYDDRQDSGWRVLSIWKHSIVSMVKHSNPKALNEGFPIAFVFCFVLFFCVDQILPLGIS